MTNYYILVLTWTLLLLQTVQNAIPSTWNKYSSMRQRTRLLVTGETKDNIAYVVPISSRLWHCFISPHPNANIKFINTEHHYQYQGKGNVNPWIMSHVMLLRKYANIWNHSWRKGLKAAPMNHTLVRIRITKGKRERSR